MYPHGTGISAGKSSLATNFRTQYCVIRLGELAGIYYLLCNVLWMTNSIPCIVLSKTKINCGRGLQGVWEHSDCSLWEQGWCEKQASEGETGYIPPEKESSILWNFCKEQLQLWIMVIFMLKLLCKDDLYRETWFHCIHMIYFGYIWDLACSIFIVFLCLCRDPNLHFVESPALAPPEVQIDLAAQQQWVFTQIILSFY
jgi:hypothetical protein